MGRWAGRRSVGRGNGKRKWKRRFEFPVSSFVRGDRSRFPLPPPFPGERGEIGDFSSTLANHRIHELGDLPQGRRLDADAFPPDLNGGSLLSEVVSPASVVSGFGHTQWTSRRRQNRIRSEACTNVPTKHQWNESGTGEELRNYAEVGGSS
eukprot:scaffold225777_cov27-Tisochrysis_lutea.AAC.1